MARKAITKGPNNGTNNDRTTWHFATETAPLLAWLDHCIQYGIEFDSTVVQHLREDANKEVVLDQVTGKLKRLWGKWGCWGFDFRDFKHNYGSPLIGLTGTEFEDIRKAKERLRPPPTGQTAEAQLRGIASTLRSRSRTLSEPRQGSDDSSLTELGSITEPESWSDDAENNDEEYCSEPSVLSKKRNIEETMPPGPILTTPQGVPGTSSKEAPKPDVKLDRDAQKDTISQGTQTIPVRHGVADGETQSRLESDLLTGEHRVKRMRSEVMTMAGHLYEARKERDELLHCNRAVQGTQDKDNMLVSLQNEIIVLKKQLLAFQETRENVALARTGHLGPSSNEIMLELEVTAGSIADACALLQWDGLLLDQPKGVSPTVDLILSQWASTLSGSDFSTFMTSCGDSGTKMADVLRSLVAAALWALVWQRSLDELVNAESPILEYFKKQLLERDGPSALHQIELFAYKILTSQPHFEAHFVADRSRTLSEYICQVLEPVFATGPEPEQVSGSESSVTTSATKPSSLFEDAVQRALELAANLYLADRVCLWHFPPPGSRVDMQTMKIAGQATAHGDDETMIVQLCIFPALYMSKALKGSAHTCERAQAMGTRGPENMGDYQLVAKSLVLVRR
ncbi:uncharacterized protein PG998_010356 [Apiospora kogelbergensis]|uniref:uncharacterized protein n=1 Tax=Apiospora kogelbergensis TaxID=1337665 RepID=UPI00312DF958